MADKNLGYKFGALFSILSLVCGLLVYTLPGPMTELLGYLTHGNFVYTPQSFDLIKLALGAILWAIIGFGSGLLYEKISGYVDKR